MTAQHFVDVELDEDGDVFLVTFVCAGTAGDICHQWCAEGCEEYCSSTPILTGAEVEIVAQAPLDGHRWEPMPLDGSYCRVVDWLDASGWNETGWNEEDTEISADQLRPGRHLIEEEWTGDDYIWRYAGLLPVEVTA